VEVVETAQGSLFVSTTPEGARILLDGRERGVTPKVIPGLAAGPHRLELEREGFKKKTARVVVRKNVIEERKFALEETFGYLSLNITPTAKIFLDDAYLVDTPIVRPVAVPTGRHRLRVVNESLKVDEEIEIVIMENETKRIDRTLQ
jgi:hypothetical protein